MKKTALFIFLTLITLVILSLPLNIFATYYTDDLCTDTSKASASTSYSGRVPSRAFDNMNTNYNTDAWETSGAMPQWIKYDFGAGNEKAIGKYTITFALGNITASNAPKNFTFQGSNDGSSWTTLDTRTNETGWSLGQKREYIFSNSTSYRYYRLYVTATNGAAYLIIGEIEMMQGVVSAPGTPGALSVESGNAQANLNWSAPSENILYTGYNVKRATSSGGPYTTVANNISSTSYLDRSLTNGITYYYIVTAVNPVGDSTPTNEVTAQPWLPVYTLDLCTNVSNASASSIFSGKGPDRAFDDSNINYNTDAWQTSGAMPQWITYNFGTGNEKTIGKYTVAFGVGNLTGGEPPNNFTFEGSNDNTNWTILDTRTSQTGWSLGEKREYTFINHTAYRYYRLNVTATNGSVYLIIGEMEMMEEVPTVPDAPGSLSIESGNAHTVLSWSAPSNTAQLTGYNVKRATSSGGPYTIVANNIPSTTYVDRGLTNGTTYYYIVTAVNPAGDSEPTDEVAVQPWLPDYTLDLCTDISKASASNVFEGRVPARAFDDLNTNYNADAWETSGALPQWLKYDFGAGNEKIIGKYTITFSYGNIEEINAAKNFTFQGSNDNINWDILDTRTNEAGWSQGEKREYTLINHTAYRYYRLYVTATNGAAYLVIGEMEMMEEVPSVPDAPEALSIESGNAHTSLSWNEPWDTTHLTGYNVKRATSSGGPYTIVANNIPFTTYVDRGLTNGTTYYYIVTAVNPAGDSEPTDEVAAQPWLPDYTLDLCTDISKASASNIFVGRGPERAFDDLNTNYNADAWETSGALPQWLKYDFGAGNEKIIGKYTITFSYGNIEEINAAKNFTFQGSNDNINWDILDTRTNEKGWSLGEKREYPFINHSAYRYYRLYVTATNGAAYLVIGEMEMMEEVPSVPGTPGTLSVESGNAHASLTWSEPWDSTHLTGYNVKRATSSGGPYTIVANNIPFTTYVDRGLTNGTTYYYIVTAVNPAGDSEPTDEVAIKPWLPDYTLDLCTDISKASASNIFVGRGPERAFDDLNTNYNADAWETSGALPQWLKYDFGAGNEKIIGKYTITFSYGNIEEINAAKNFTFQGSNDNINWDILDTRTNEKGWSLGEKREYPFINHSSYRYYRLYVTATNGAAYLVIGEMEMMEEVPSVPDTPGTLSIEAGNAHASLTWSAPSDTTHLTGYNVKRATASGGPYTIVANNIPFTAYVDRGLTNGTTYYYIVTAVNPAGDSEPTEEVAAQPWLPDYTTDLCTDMSQADASNIFTGRVPGRAFDDLNTDYADDAWETSGAMPQWIEYDFGAGNEKTIGKYTITFSYGNITADNAPKNFIFQGSNDGSSWTSLDTRTNETGWSLGEKREYPFVNHSAYRCYRLYVTESNGAIYLVIGEMEMMAEAQ